MPADRPHLWHMPLLGSAGKVLWVPQLRLDWSVQMKKSRPLVSFMRVLSKRYRKRGPWELRGDLFTWAAGQVLSETEISL